MLRKYGLVFTMVCYGMICSYPLGFSKTNYALKKVIAHATKKTSANTHTQTRTGTEPVKTYNTH